MRLSQILAATLPLLLLGACSQAPKAEVPVAAKPLLPVVIAPLDTSKTFSHIQFGSCADQKKPEPLWTTMLKDGPDLYLGMGDNIYSSLPEEKPLTKTYALQAQVPEFNKFRATVPMLATWDDHDFGVNDGGADNPDKAINKQAFLDFYPWDAKMIPASQEGVYHSVILGKGKNTVQVIFLDTRWFRSSLEKQEHPKSAVDIYRPTQDKSKTFLGEAQWKWLKGELKKKAAFRILVSSVQLIHTSHSFEHWGNFPHERERLFALLKQTRAKPLIVISGDRHQGEIHQVKIPGYGDLYDVTASGINKISKGLDEPSPTRVYQIFQHENYGTVDLDWKARKAHVSLRDMQGETKQSIDIAL